MGAGVGIGIGLGRGMGDIAEAIIARKRAHAVDRDQNAEELLKKAGAIAANRTALAAQNPQDPQIGILDKQGQDLIGQANALYAPHEKSGFMQKIQQVFHGGSTPQPAKPKRHYSWETEMAAAPRPASRTPGGIPGDAGKPFEKDGKWYRPVEINGQLTTQEMPPGWSGSDEKKPYKTGYHPSTGGLAEITDPNTGVVWHAGNIAQAPPAVQSQWKAIKDQETVTAKAKTKKVSDFQAFLGDLYGETPTAAQRLDAHQRWTGAGAETVGTHIIQVPQPDGSIKVFETTTSSRKSLPGMPGAPAGAPARGGAPRSGIAPPGTAAPPKTAGDAKGRLRELGVAGGRETTADKLAARTYNEAAKDYQGAVDRARTMDENLHNALQGDQQAMLSLVANHIGMTLGAQRGARITRAVWDEAIQSTPWFQRIAAKFDDRGFLSGVTLAPEQMKQMVKLAHEKVGTLKDHVERVRPGTAAAPAGPGRVIKYKRDAQGNIVPESQ